MWNSQLVSYAGYADPDNPNDIVGDPANVEFTEVSAAKCTINATLLLLGQYVLLSSALQYFSCFGHQLNRTTGFSPFEQEVCNVLKRQTKTYSVLC